ncbi:hypothetical protein F4679DRAFT_593472 [Xylaria curta]|nr:hypothetical protein F4679DRAFT_593472 [Xylaria curta]
MDTHKNVYIKWCPGHCAVEGNERADELAKQGTDMAPNRDLQPTAYGLRAEARKALNKTREALWDPWTEDLSTRYRRWKLLYKITCPPELWMLTRQELHRWLATQGLNAHAALPLHRSILYAAAGLGDTFAGGMTGLGYTGTYAILTRPGAGRRNNKGHNQGVDLYGQFGHEILNAAEYVAKYNTGHDVPYTAYESWEGNLTVISAKSRYDVRPGYKALISHYSGLKGMNAS